MWKTVLRRLLMMIPQIIFEHHCFLCCEDDAGDPFTGLIDPNIDPAIIEQKRIAGYYDPIPVQYFRWW